MKTIDPSKEVAIIWHIDDVKSLNKDLSDSQCLAILYYCKDNHHKDAGINYDCISYAIDELYPEIENSLAINHKNYLESIK